METQPRLDRDPPYDKGILTEAPEPPKPPFGRTQRDHSGCGPFIVLVVLIVIAILLAVHLSP